MVCNEGSGLGRKSCRGSPATPTHKLASARRGTSSAGNLSRRRVYLVDADAVSERAGH